MQAAPGLRASGRSTRYIRSPEFPQNNFVYETSSTNTRRRVSSTNVRLRKGDDVTSTEWNKTRDSITIRPDKKTGERIREAAKAEGMSVQAFLLKAAEYQIKTKGCYKVAYPKEIVDALAKNAKVRPSEFLRQLSPLQGTGGTKTTDSPKKK